jgi:hypothetical protein
MGANRARLEDASAQQPTQHLVGAAVGDRCATCGAPMASDQHYCINCGERRGKPRFGLGGGVAPAAMAAPPSPPRRRKPKISSASALVAGVGTLLLAMGVGVLIGRTDSNNNQKAASAPPVQVVTVAGQGGGSAAAAPTSTGAAGSTTKAAAKSSTSKTKHTAAKKKVKVVVTKQEATKAQAAATKVLGSDAKNLPPPTVTQRQKGNGPGFKHGHFTGEFFGQ